MTKIAHAVTWQLTEVTSPTLPAPVPVIAAKAILYVLAANRYQNYHVYLPVTAETKKLVGSLFESLPGYDPKTALPTYQVHLHGGAWRDPNLTAFSIEPTVAHAFGPNQVDPRIKAIISISYSLSPFPTHPTEPYDPNKGDHGDLAREAVHPQHIQDALTAFDQLRTQGLTDDSYVLTAHSAGACIAFQFIMRCPSEWGFRDLPSPPRPAAVVGINGLYHLPALVDGLGSAHAGLRDEYTILISQAFGTNPVVWENSSPALLEPDSIARLIRRGVAPRLVLLDQSAEDQLVPMNQREHLASNLEKVDGLHLVRGDRCKGIHAAPWERGDMMWQLVQDALDLLS